MTWKRPNGCAKTKSAVTAFPLRIRPYSTLLLLAVLVLCCAPWARAQHTVQDQGSKKTYLSPQGQELFTEKCDALGWPDGSVQPVDGVVGVQRRGKWGLLDLAGKTVVGAYLLQLRPHAQAGLVLAQAQQRDGTRLWGAFNSRGKIVIPFSYLQLHPAGSAVVASKSSGSGTQFGVLDKRGEVALRFSQFIVRPGVGPYVWVEHNDTRHQIFNTSTKTYDPWEYSQVQPLGTDYLLVMKAGLLGAYHAHAGQLLPPEYVSIDLTAAGSIQATPLPEWEFFTSPDQDRQVQFQASQVQLIGEAVVWRRGAELLLELESKEVPLAVDSVAPLARGWWLLHRADKLGLYHGPSDKALAAEKDSIVQVPTGFWLLQSGQWQFVNQALQPAQQRYRTWCPAGPSHFAAKRRGAWGLLTSRAEELALPRYDQLVFLAEGQWLAQYFEEWGIIDEKGNWLELPGGAILGPGHQGQYLKKTDTGYGVVEAERGLLFQTTGFLRRHPLGYTEHRYFPQAVGLWSPQGQPLLRCEYDSLVATDQGYLLWQKGRQGFVDLGGELVVPPQRNVEKLAYGGGNHVIIRRNGSFGALDHEAKLRIANRYDSLRPFSEGLAPFSLLGRWGYINTTDQVAIQPIYDQVWSFEGGLAQVQLANKQGLIDHKGEWRLQADYDSVTYLPGLGYLLFAEGKVGLASDEGRLVERPSYEAIQPLGPQWLGVKRTGRWGVVSRSNGRDLVPRRYTQLIWDGHRQGLWAQLPATPVVVAP